MKKTRILVSSLLAAVMLVGAGYAAWTDKLTINNTVSTGELKVEFVKQQNDKNQNETFPRINSFYYVQGASKGIWQLSNDKNTYIDSSVLQSADNKSLDIVIGNMYPGSLVGMEAKIENKGTIPAVIDSVDLKLNPVPNDADSSSKKWNTKEMQSSLGIYAGITYHAKNKNGQYDVVKEKNRWNSATMDGFAKKITDGGNGLKGVRGLVIEPGDYITFDMPDEGRKEIAAALGVEDLPQDNCINFTLPRDADKSLQNQGLSFKLVINFKQQNVK